MRGELTRPVRFRLDDLTDDEITAWAERANKSRSDLLRAIVRQAVRREKRRQQVRDSQAVA